MASGAFDIKNSVLFGKLIIRFLFVDTESAGWRARNKFYRVKVIALFI